MMGTTETQARMVHVQFDVDPNATLDDADLRSLGGFVMELAKDRLLFEDDPDAWREQNKVPLELTQKETE